jgi:hypothetical protein
LTSTATSKCYSYIFNKMVNCNHINIICAQQYSHGASCQHSHNTTSWTPQQYGRPDQSLSLYPVNRNIEPDYFNV